MAKRIKPVRENRLFEILERIYPGEYYIRNGYYSFLMSPKKKPMQLDIYYPDLNIAFEYQGSQHSRYNKFFFKNKKQFQYLKTCDRLKKKLCKKLGITLICIDYTKELTVEYVKMRIIKAGRGDTIGNRGS